MNWYIPDLEPYLLYAWAELSRWQGANPYIIGLILGVLGWLKVWALKSKNVVDDKIVSLLIYVFGFKWLKVLTEKKDAPKT